MDKEVPLKERIEKLYENGYVNEFNYLENQLQEARYLVTILHKQTEKKDKEIERLNNIIEELEKYINKEFYIVGNSPKGSFYEGYDTCLEEMKQEILNKLKELKEGKE